MSSTADDLCLLPLCRLNLKLQSLVITADGTSGDFLQTLRPPDQRPPVDMHGSHLHSFLDAFQDNPLLSEWCHQVSLQQ